MAGESHRLRGVLYCLVGEAKEGRRQHGKAMKTGPASEVREPEGEPHSLTQFPPAAVDV